MAPLESEEKKEEGITHHGCGAAGTPSGLRSLSLLPWASTIAFLTTRVRKALAPPRCRNCSGSGWVLVREAHVQQLPLSESGAMVGIPNEGELVDAEVVALIETLLAPAAGNLGSSY